MVLSSYWLTLYRSPFFMDRFEFGSNFSVVRNLAEGLCRFRTLEHYAGRCPQCAAADGVGTDPTPSTTAGPSRWIWCSRCPRLTRWRLGDRWGSPLIPFVWHRCDPGRLCAVVASARRRWQSAMGDLRHWTLFVCNSNLLGSRFRFRI